MEKGRIRPLIGKVFPFSEAVAAYTLLQNGPSPGKLVLKMWKHWKNIIYTGIFTQEESVNCVISYIAVVVKSPKWFFNVPETVPMVSTRSWKKGAGYQKGPKKVPKRFRKCSKKVPKRFQKGPKKVPKRSQNGPKMVPNVYITAPKRSLNGPKTVS